MNSAAPPPLAPQTVGSKTVQRGRRRVDLVAVAKAQKVLLYLILANLLFFPVAITLLSSVAGTASGWILTLFAGVLYAGMVLAAVVQIVRFAVASGTNPVLAVLFGPAMFIPLLNIVLLASLNGRATSMLRCAGVRVGFMGTGAAEMLKLVQGACSGCGYDLRGLPAQAPCPECGTQRAA